MSDEAITVDGIIYYSTEYVGKLCEIHRQLEQERIIKLLINERWDAPFIASPYVQHAITLISDNPYQEGENK